MNISDPKFVYILLVLPVVFGLTLIGDGIGKLFHENSGGIISLAFGTFLVGVVILSLFVFPPI